MEQNNFSCAKNEKIYRGREKKNFGAFCCFINISSVRHYFTDEDLRESVSGLLDQDQAKSKIFLMSVDHP